MAEPYRIEEDPRFLRGVELFNSGEFLDASEEFEDLFFEAVRDEVEFIRFFLQIAVGIHHVERGQLNAAVERLRVALDALDRIEDERGWSLAMQSQIGEIIGRIQQRARGVVGSIEWPKLRRKA